MATDTLDLGIGRSGAIYRERTSNNPHPRYESIGFSQDRLPYLGVLTGHSASGKTEVSDGLLRKMQYEHGAPARKVINYKDREARGPEVESVDFIQIPSHEKYSELITNGDIVVPYMHSGRMYGLSRRFLDELKAGHIPIMVTDISGLTRLRPYLEDRQVPNKLLSFVLHTTRNDAESRLRERAEDKSETEQREAEIKIRGLNDEMERYRSHEESFRHIIRNATPEGMTAYQAIMHTINRVVDAMYLERELNKNEDIEFRVAYPEYVAGRLFGTSLQDLLSSINQGVQLRIPDVVIESYSLEKGIEPSFVRSIATRHVVSLANFYGILSLYLEPTLTTQQKIVLVDLIKGTVGLTPQYEQRGIMPLKHSKYTLKEVIEGYEDLTDFLLSFSSFDPMVPPYLLSPVHTIAFEGLTHDRPPTVKPASEGRAEDVLKRWVWDLNLKI